MRKKICLALSLTVFCYWAESSPVSLGTLEFDNLDTDVADLKYEIEEEDIDDFSQLLDGSDEKDKSTSKTKDKSKTNVKTSGFKKKNTANKGLKSKYNIQDLKKFFKTGAVRDQGSYDDDGIYAIAKGAAGTAIGIKGNENRKYKKGTKVKGFHHIHHKDEYKKDKEFYEEDETGGTIKKVGAKALGVKIGAGAGFRKGHYRHDHAKGVFGKEGYADKGFFDKEFSGFADLQGFEGAFKNDS